MSFANGGSRAYGYLVHDVDVDESVLVLAQDVGVLQGQDHALALLREKKKREF